MDPDPALNYNIIRHISFSSQGLNNTIFCRILCFFKNLSIKSGGGYSLYWGGQRHSAMRKRAIQYFFAEYDYLLQTRHLF